MSSAPAVSSAAAPPHHNAPHAHATRMKPLFRPPFIRFIVPLLFLVSDRISKPAFQ